jgi:cytochrome c-type biogenesis protein CcmE
MKPRHKRLLLIAAGLSALGLAAWLVLSAFKDNLMHFYTPTQILSGAVPGGRHIHIGGMVVKGSLHRLADGVTVSFVVTDLAHEIPVTYHGILPDLFKEGKGVVAEGRLDAQNQFVATEVLAKHDENYMPPDAAYALKQGQAIKNSTTR